MRNLIVDSVRVVADATDPYTFSLEFMVSPAEVRWDRLVLVPLTDATGPLELGFLRGDRFYRVYESLTGAANTSYQAEGPLFVPGEYRPAARLTTIDSGDVFELHAYGEVLS